MHGGGIVQVKFLEKLNCYGKGANLWMSSKP
jgi:hypothetical protein